MKTAVVWLLLVMVFSFAGPMNGESLAANEYSGATLRWVIPFGPGGGMDRWARAFVPYLEEELGANIVIENMGGAGGEIGFTNIANSSPDGFTMGTVLQPNASIAIHVQDAAFSLDDFTWINFHQKDPISIAVLKDAPWDDFKDVVDFIEDNPGQFAISTTPITGARVVLAFLQSRWDLDFIFVPYAGGGDARAALLGGHDDAIIGQEFNNYGLREQLKAVWTLGEERSDLWPEAPTLYEMFDYEKAKELDAFATNLGAQAAVVFPKGFDEQYPERYEEFVKAYKRALENPDYLEVIDKLGAKAITAWRGPEHALELVRSSDEIINEWKFLFLED